jgi:myo-inositol-1(or 4)-monophosphatase
MRPKLDEIELMALQAGAILRAGYGQKHHVQYKSVIDPVTEVDKRSEKFLIEQIHSRYPDHTLIAEESGLLAGTNSYSWYVDPLDGTVNFAHSLPIFAVSIAYAEEGQLLMGVVYDPMMDELFSAERGKGACLNGSPIHVSETGDLIQSLLVTGFTYDLKTRDQNLPHFSHLTQISQGVRRLGSAALDLCYIAAGRLDGYWELELGPWDLAAGALIAQEGGAIVSDMQGGESYLRPPYAIIAANPHIFPLMLKELQG